MMRKSGERLESVFADFFRAHYVSAVSLTQWRAPDGDAEAIVAEAFLAAWQHMLTGAIMSPGWFYLALRNKIGDHYRSHKRREVLIEDLQPLGIDLAGHDYDEIVVQRVFIFNVLNDMPLQQAEALALVYVCDLSPQDAARALGVSHGALRKRLECARNLFALKVADEYRAVAGEES